MTPSHPTDAALLAAAREDPDAFRVLYRRHAERLHGYFRRRSGDPQAALDLTAETFARAWIARARFEDRASGSAAPWLFGIAHHVLVSSARQGAIERSAIERLGMQEGLDRLHGAPAALPDEHWLDGADELLDTLPPAQREAVRLRVLDGLDYELVARELGTTRSTARVRVHRGLAALRTRTATEDLTR